MFHDVPVPQFTYKYHHLPNRVTFRFSKQSEIFTRQFINRYWLIIKINEICISNGKSINTPTNCIQCAFRRYFLKILQDMCMIYLLQNHTWYTQNAIGHYSVWFVFDMQISVRLNCRVKILDPSLKRSVMLFGKW